jgi:hypothetical protein
VVAIIELAFFIQKTMKISVFKDLFKSKDVPFLLPIETIIDRIKSGTSRVLVEQIRATKDSNLRNALKNTLPSILFAG